MSIHRRLDDGMRWQADAGSIERKPGQGRPRAPMARGDRHSSIIARRNRGATASQLSRYLYAATGTRVSRVTVLRRLYKSGLFARRPAVCEFRTRVTLRPYSVTRQGKSPFSMVKTA
ncbi:HTH_Tnp_Tc3_2 domain-containing protein [Trichonephila clavipes]|nr:HTH_Tnp_Tc3_2 domain-containing protein [Trichonephila clavipes]